MANCPSKCKKAETQGEGGNCPFLMSAYILAGFAMMLNIRLSYSSAPYALIRFGLPENLFSVFVRRMASSLELWCLPSMLLGNLMDLGVKGGIGAKGDSDNEGKKKIKFWGIIVPSIISQWLNFLTYVILFFVYLMGGDQGHLTRFYWIIAVSGFVFGISNPLVFAADYNYIPIYIAGENCFPALTSFIHYLATLMFGNRRKWNSDFIIVYIDIMVAIIISFVAAMMWTLGYGIFTGTTDGDTYGHIHAEGFGSLEDAKASMAAPLLIVLVGMGLVYAIYPGIAPGMIVPFYLVDKIEMVLLIATIFPPVIIAILRRTSPNWSPTTKFVWHGNNRTNNGFHGWTWYKDHLGAPSDASAAGTACDTYSSDVDVYAWIWHAFDLIVPIMIILAYIFIYSLHYRDSKLSHSIVNQPKMSTALTIIFYMCHEISLAVGFAGMVGNGAEYTVLVQLVGAFLMVFLALYSEGYIIEYKTHDPAHWPTEGMTTWNAFCYWCKRASKITNQKLRSLFQRFSDIFTWLPYTLLY